MRPDDAELRAWVDDELDGERAAIVARAVAADPRLARTAATLRAARLPVREAYERIGRPPVPPALERRVRELIATHPWTDAPAASVRDDHAPGDGSAAASRDRHDAAPPSAGGPPAPAAGAGKARVRSRLRRAAAIATLALGTGWLGHELGQRGEGTSPAASSPASDDTARWVRRVAEYQSLYVRATVERDDDTDVEDVAPLLERLGARDGLDPHVPALDDAGYRFVRAQELGWRDAPLVQIVYLAEDGPPLALCFMPDAGEDSPLRVDAHAGLGTATWRRDDQRFVLVGDLPPAELEALSRHVDAAWSVGG